MIYRISGTPTIPEWMITRLNYKPDPSLSIGIVYHLTPDEYFVYLDDSSLKLGDDISMKLLAIGRNIIYSHFYNEKKRNNYWRDELGKVKL